MAKGFIGLSLILLAIVFGITIFEAPDVGGEYIQYSYSHDPHFIFAGVFEWIIAFGYTFYLLTFWYDLRLSKNVPKGELKERYGLHATHPELGSSVNMMQIG